MTCTQLRFFTFERKPFFIKIGSETFVVTFGDSQDWIAFQKENYESVFMLLDFIGSKRIILCNDFAGKYYSIKLNLSDITFIKYCDQDNASNETTN